MIEIFKNMSIQITKILTTQSLEICNYFTARLLDVIVQKHNKKIEKLNGLKNMIQTEWQDISAAPGQTK